MATVEEYRQKHGHNRCAECYKCDIVTDRELCKHLVCTATKRCRTITWFMHILNKNVFQLFANWCDHHNTPSWCPIQKELKNGIQESQNGDVLGV